MNILRRFDSSRIWRALGWTTGILLIGVVLFAGPAPTHAQNMDCTLIVPADPLSAAGLATPYQLVATNSMGGPCDELNANQSAFVQGAVIDKDTGQIAIYNPLVINQGTTPAAPPVVPVLPARRVVALWFGFNANNLTLVGHGDDLQDNHCAQHLGQFAYCNAVAFFDEAEEAIDAGKLHVPPLGTSPVDHQACPSVRSFTLVDQDQSDNVTTIYLFNIMNGQVAQNTAANRSMGLSPRGNPSDNRLLDALIDPALGCTPWTAPDLADPGSMVPALPLNELQALMHQKRPIARVPLGDPFTFAPPLTGGHSLAQVNRYRRGVDQQHADDDEDASTTTYCAHLRSIHPAKLKLDQAILKALKSPFPDVANTLFTFMAQRYVASYQILNCQALLGEPVNVTLVVQEPGGLVTDATIQ